MQVVLENSDVRCSEEVRLRGMERNCLNDAFSGAEGSLTVSFAYTMNQHLACRLDVVSYRSEVVTFGMPADLADDIFQSQSNHCLNLNWTLELPSAW